MPRQVDFEPLCFEIVQRSPSIWPAEIDGAIDGVDQVRVIAFAGSVAGIFLPGHALEGARYMPPLITLVQVAEMGQ